MINWKLSGSVDKEIQCVRIVFLLLLVVPMGNLRASGAKVTMVLESGQHIAGELLALADSTLIVAIDFGLREESLRTDTAKLVKVGVNDIRAFNLCGRSYLADGMLLGMVGGAGIGALVSYTGSGFDTYNSNIDPTGPGAGAMIIGFLGGALLGGFLGEIAGTGDEEVNSRDWHRLGYLKGLTRYADRDLPDFLEKYIHK